jgi:hypothetical protein
MLWCKAIVGQDSLVLLVVRLHVQLLPYRRKQYVCLSNVMFPHPNNLMCMNHPLQIQITFLNAQVQLK